MEHMNKKTSEDSKEPTNELDELDDWNKKPSQEEVEEVGQYL